MMEWQMPEATGNLLLLGPKLSCRCVPPVDHAPLLTIRVPTSYRAGRPWCGKRRRAGTWPARRWGMWPLRDHRADNTASRLRRGAEVCPHAPAHAVSVVNHCSKRRSYIHSATGTNTASASTR